MTSKKSLSERDICTKFILPAIVNAGWDNDRQIREEVFFTDGRIFVKGQETRRGERKRADFILYQKPNIPVAVIEAKDNSTMRVAQELNQLGLRRKLYKIKTGKTYGGKPFDMDGVLTILQQKAYMGSIQNTRTKQAFPGQHKPIIEPGLFAEVQKLLLSRNHRGGEVHFAVNKHGFLLKGLLSCGECGNAIVPTFGNKKGKAHLYYKCLSGSNGLPHNCAITPLGARKLEAYIVENIAAIGWDRPFLESVVLKTQQKAKECLTPLAKDRQVIEGQLKTIQGELRQLVNLVKAGSASAEVADEIQHLEEAKKDLAGRILKIETLTSHSLKAVYDVDVIQGTFQRFAIFINRLPVDLQVKAIRLLVERITIFKDHVVVKIFESPVEDIQKALDEKFVFWGCCLPEQGGPKTNFKQNNPRIGVVEVDKSWRCFQDIVRTYFAQHPEITL